MFLRLNKAVPKNDTSQFKLLKFKKLLKASTFNKIAIVSVKELEQ